MKFGKIYFARVENWDDIAPAGAEDLVIFNVNFSHSDKEAATVDIECEYPQTGLMFGPRFGVLSIEVDGVETEIARGQIVGHPVALPGQIVTVELICRRPDHSDQIDAIYEEYDITIPPELADETVARRSEPYVSGYPYIDPVTLDASFAWIAGVTSTDGVIVGENGSGDVSDVFDMKMSITDTPATEVEITAETFFVEERMREIDLFDDRDGQFQAMTMTPNSLRTSLQSPVIDGSGYEFLEGSLSTTLINTLRVKTEERQVDPWTCAVTPAEWSDVGIYRIDSGALNILAFAEQPRREILKFRMVPQTQDIGGGEVVTENLTISNVTSRMEDWIPYSFKDAEGNTTIKSKKLVARRRFWFDGNGEFCPENQDILYPIAYRAAKILNERAHCVDLTMSVRLSAVFGRTLKDRITISDIRLTGGYATGRIKSINYQIGSSEVAEIVLSCPITDPNNQRSADFYFNFSFEHDGDEDTVPASPAVDALRNGGAESFFIDEFKMENLSADQAIALTGYAEGNPDAEAISDPMSVVPPTSFTVDLAEAEPVPIDDLGDHEVRLKAATLYLPHGIVLS